MEDDISGFFDYVLQMLTEKLPTVVIKSHKKEKSSDGTSSARIPNIWEYYSNWR